MSLFNSKIERIRMIKFSIVGVSGTIVDFGLMNLFSLVFGLHLAWAQAISFTIAVLNNFFWNRIWTYPESRSRGASKQLMQFILINVIGIIIRTPIITLLDRWIFRFIVNSDLALPVNNLVLSQNLALAISIGIIFIWNYFANRNWTFNNVPAGDKPGKEKTYIDNS